MRFERIAITGGQADLPDPRSAPEDVPDAAIKKAQNALTGTDEQPVQAVLTLEGTAAQTADVELFVLDEPTNDDPFISPEQVLVAKAARRFYSLGTTPVTVTVGEVAFHRVVPGPVYYRITSAPAADAVLKIGFVAGEP